VSRFLACILVTSLCVLSSCGGSEPATAGGSVASKEAAPAPGKGEKPVASSSSAGTEAAVPPAPAELRSAVKRLGSTDEFERVAAVMELGTASGLDHPSVQQALLQAIQDPSSDVRAEAAKSLPASLGSQEAARKLTAMMKDDAEISVRRAAIAALASTQDPSAARLIADHMAKEKDGTVQLEALIALAHLADPSTLEAIRPHLVAPEATRIRAAIQAVMALKAVSEAPTLVGLLNDMSPAVRSTAAEGLGALGAKDKKTLLALGALLTDEEQQVRKQAITALRKLTTADIDYFYDEADEKSLKGYARDWVDWIEKNG